ncbi:hypothetical protein MJD09_14845 [bacterium]|nr:hypothetical protein [bacterium]
MPEEFDKTTGKRWIETFGLDFMDRNGVAGNPDGAVDLHTGVVDLVKGELHFPDLQPFDPEGYMVGGATFDELPQEKRVPALYDTTVQSVIRAQSKFRIEISTKKGS